MSYSIPSSTKILNLTTAPFLFILVSALSVCKFAMVPGVYILLYPLEEEVHSSSWGHGHIQQHNHQKDLNPCLSLYYYGKVIVELEKNTSLTVFTVFVIWPSSTLKFLFVFISVNVWQIFSLRNRQQRAFIRLNRFCPLRKHPQPPVLNEQNQARWNPKQN